MSTDSDFDAEAFMAHLMGLAIDDPQQLNTALREFAQLSIGNIVDNWFADMMMVWEQKCVDRVIGEQGLMLGYSICLPQPIIRTIIRANEIPTDSYPLDGWVWEWE